MDRVGAVGEVLGSDIFPVDLGRIIEERDLLHGSVHGIIHGRR